MMKRVNSHRTKDEECPVTTNIEEKTLLDATVGRSGREVSTQVAYGIPCIL